MGLEMLGAIGGIVGGASAAAQTGLGIANSLGQSGPMSEVGAGGANPFAGGGAFGVTPEGAEDPSGPELQPLTPVQQPQFMNPYMNIGRG